eukprot:1160142-Pelagomonas_calceolata.AAC.17
MVFDGSQEPVMNICFSPDDERIAGTSMDGKVVVFETESTGEGKGALCVTQSPKLTAQVVASLPGCPSWTNIGARLSCLQFVLICCITFISSHKNHAFEGPRMTVERPRNDCSRGRGRVWETGNTFL